MFEFDDQVDGWVGISPEEIEGEENPTLTLEAGELYRIGWTQGDDQEHNIEIRDEDDAVVDDLETEVTNDPDDDQWLEFEATADVAVYVCDPHDSLMRGDLDVE